MTEERKKYLASISKEERAIRYAIKYQQDVMCNCKDDLNNPLGYSAPASILKQQIADTKAIIKSLKKQLPAPKKKQHLGRTAYIICCPMCKSGVPSVPCYCGKCGQKLR